MNKRKLLIGLATAGTFSAGFGAAVLPASAEQRTLRVTLLGGQSIVVNVDVPPGTPLDQIQIPGVSLPILKIEDLSGPATQPAQPPPAPPPTEPAAPSAPAAPGDPEAPVVEQQAAKDQPTTGKAKRALRKAVEHAGAQAQQVAGEARGQARKQTRTGDGVPTAANPTFSYALPGAAPIGVPNFFIDKFRIPPFLLPIYQAAGIQYGVRWEVLAAINEIETDYGRNLNVSTAGAVGWMQFMPATWKRYGVDANDDGRKDPYNPVDAIFASARYLKAADAAQDIKKAVFAYNHADWYVDSVLLRARLIGGLPSDLVGSLTGLTQGHFPVHATARYADDLSEAAAKRRVAKGHNAAVPIDAKAGRRGIDIFAKPGSPVVAVQDGKVVNIGRTKRLGRFIQLQDVYGNTYTYGHLKKIAKAYPVPKDKKLAKATAANALDLPKDPAPTQPASAGVQPKQTHTKAAKVAQHVTTATTAAAAQQGAEKERLFANPTRNRAYKAGGEEQVLNTGGTTFKSYFTQPTSLKRSDVTIKPLRKGSKVIAGTILGRIGTHTDPVRPAKAPHVKFEIRPAGRGAPRIDPKPILDGWKLLESTAVYRAAGKNPFFGPDAKNPSIGQILLMSKEALARRVLTDPRIDVYTGGDQDIKAGQIDRRVLATLEFLSASGLKPTVTSLKGNHSRMTRSGNVSEHSTGTAVDIAKINGIPITGHQGAGSITDITVRRLLSLQGTMKPHQIISLMTFEGTDNTLALPDHADHIHVGFRPLYGENTKLGKQLNAVLKPKQWIKLIDRIGQIDNPTVLTTPSKYAVPVPKKLLKPASTAHKGE
jgi:hypothetical protein